jgi:hypothetical protein
VAAQGQQEQGVVGLLGGAWRRLQVQAQFAAATRRF